MDRATWWTGVAEAADKQGPNTILLSLNCSPTCMFEFTMTHIHIEAAPHSYIPRIPPTFASEIQENTPRTQGKFKLRSTLSTRPQSSLDSLYLANQSSFCLQFGMPVLTDDSNIPINSHPPYPPTRRIRSDIIRLPHVWSERDESGVLGPWRYFVRW